MRNKLIFVIWLCQNNLITYVRLHQNSIRVIQSSKKVVGLARNRFFENTPNCCSRGQNILTFTTATATGICLLVDPWCMVNPHIFQTLHMRFVTHDFWLISDCLQAPTKCCNLHFVSYVHRRHYTADFAGWLVLSVTSKSTFMFYDILIGDVPL